MFSLPGSYSQLVWWSLAYTLNSLEPTLTNPNFRTQPLHSRILNDPGEKPKSMLILSIHLKWSSALPNNLTAFPLLFCSPHWGPMLHILFALQTTSPFYYFTSYNGHVSYLTKTMEATRKEICIFSPPNILTSLCLNPHTQYHHAAWLQGTGVILQSVWLVRSGTHFENNVYFVSPHSHFSFSL